MRRDRRNDPARSAASADSYRLGLAALERGECAAAIDLLSKIQNDHNLPATLARYYLGQAHQQEGLTHLRERRYPKAVEHLAAARTLNPGGENLSAFLATAYAGAGRFDLAALELERPSSDLERERNRPIALAHACVRDGRREDAVAVLRRAIEHDPTDVEYSLQLGLIHAAVEDFAAAIALFESALQWVPRDERLHRELGLAYAATKDWGRSLEHLAEAQRSRPNDAHLAWLLGQAAQAASQAGQVATLNPGQPRTASAQSDCGLPTSPERASIDALEKIVLSEPDFVEAFLSLPASEVDRHVFSMLASVLSQALEHHPEFADLHYHCSRVQERLGNGAEAIDAARRAVGINPRYAQALVQLSKLYAGTERAEEAIERLNQAIDAGGDWPDVHCLLGELYKRKGDRPRAASAYRRALVINGGFAQARRALEALAGV